MSKKPSYEELEKRISQLQAELESTNEPLRREIEERQRVEEELAAEKERLSVILRTVGDGVITTDVDGKQEFVSHYVIYRGTEPLFEPSVADSVGEVPGDSHEYYDPDVVGQTGVNHFYVVKAVDCGANKSNASNRVGEFDRRLSNVK